MLVLTYCILILVRNSTVLLPVKKVTLTCSFISAKKHQFIHSMAKSGSKLLLVFAVAAIIIVALANDDDATATASPSTICNMGVLELAQCLPEITGNSPPRPTKSCCAVMKKANLRCLCNYKSQFTNFGIDPKVAMALPKKCGRKLPRECTRKL